jgi:hypothetical protein
LAVEPPLRVEHREELVWLPVQACELEQLAARADRLSGTAGLAELAELATDLHGMARDIESA